MTDETYMATYNDMSAARSAKHDGLNRGDAWVVDVDEAAEIAERLQAEAWDGAEVSFREFMATLSTDAPWPQNPYKN